MKRQMNKKWVQFARLRKVDLILTLLPALLWVCATLARPYLIQPNCLSQPSTCTIESLPKIDQFSAEKEDEQADFYSYQTQNLSGAIALAGPMTWNTALYFLGSMAAPV